jgi:hypothetical protein
MQWMHHLSFQEACEQLRNGVPLPAEALSRALPIPKSKQGKTEFDARAYQKRVDAAQDALFKAPGATPGRDYLLQRGLEPHTWMAYTLGYAAAVSLPGTQGQQKAPAIVIPWYVAGKLAAVRYRFLKKHTYLDAAGREREAKQTAAFGSRFSGKLFGGQQLLWGAEALRTLVICEGEINAMSIWQIAHHTQLDILSLGSESQRLTPAMVAYAQQYRTVILWLDQAKYVVDKMKLVDEALGYQTPTGEDANDVLQKGRLGSVLSGIRRAATRNPAELERLLWDLWDGANTLYGVDRGTRDVMQAIADELQIAI